MASTYKTAHLQLNNWAGGDKPKRDDFNDDNAKIDTEIGSLRTRLAAADAHESDLSRHVTAAEKALWNAGGAGGGIETGTYTGNGTASRTVDMGFKPKFGFLFAVGQGVVDGNWNTGESNLFSGFFSQEGCSKGIALTSNGVTVTHNGTQPLNGCALKLNQSGTVYVYLAWKA